MSHGAHMCTVPTARHHRATGGVGHSDPARKLNHATTHEFPIIQGGGSVKNTGYKEQELST